jgi:hypothetical protein
MLDAYIIERIRQQREEPRGTTRVPLRIDTPIQRPEEPIQPRRNEEEERGVAIIDFTV